VLTESILAKAATIVVGMVMQNKGVQTALLRKIGRHPVERAVAAALAATVAEPEQYHPGWAAALFDASFFEHEAAPVFADVITRGRAPSAIDLARRYVASLGPNRQARQSIRQAELVAADALGYFTAAVQRQDVLREALDSKALAEALSAVDEYLGHPARSPANDADAQPNSGRQLPWPTQGG
jgi:hypothetical protein